MRAVIITAIAALAVPSVLAQTTPAGAPGAQAQAAVDGLPVRRVVLYKTGVGFFEHRGRVTGDQEIAIRFTSGQLNDVLKSLTALDLGGGTIASIRYNSVEPIDRRVSALRLPVGRNATLVDLLTALRGARVVLGTNGTSVSGRLLGVERQRRRADANGAVDVDVVSIITDAGELRAFDVDPSLRVRLADGDLRQEIGQYLDLVGSAREQDVRRMLIRTAGAGERDVYVSYVSEVPVWKTTYRLVLPDEGPALLQGWAVVDNTIGEDWTGVQLSLVAGAPQTFVQQISQPYYARRPVVPLPQTAMLTPQTHAATLESGPATLIGAVRDPAGGALPGVQVTLHGGARELSAITDARGNYSVTAPPGTYQVVFRLAGFSTVSLTDITLDGGVIRQRDMTMRVGGLEETITVSSETPVRVGGALGGSAGSIARTQELPPPPPASPVPDAQRLMQPAASAADLGDLFEYRITAPVTILKNESALVPILNTEVRAEKVSLWSRASGSGRPLRAVWLANASPLTLDGGTFSVVEGEAFAGEGLMDPLEPGERRLLSYAADLGVLVSAEGAGSTNRIVGLRARDGIVIQETEERATATYRIRNEDGAPRVVVVEHPVRNGWELTGGTEPAERAPASYRFRVPVEARGEVMLDVPERRTVQSRIGLGSIDDSRIELWIRAGLAAAEVERSLNPVLEAGRAVVAMEQQLTRLETERQTIVGDQERLRENLRALGRSSEERQLIERYTRQLDEGENRLEVLRGELAGATEGLDRARGELARLVGEVSFELTASAN
jgi:hypothetical protein